MAALYLFSLVLGGGFLALSLLGDLLGGHGDVDVSGDLGGFDGHVELDTGAPGGPTLAAGHVGVDAAHAELEADAGHAASKIFSIRTLFYSLFGFGAVGSALTFLWSGSAVLTAGFAIVAGLASGALVNTAFGYVRRSESGLLPSETSFAGLTGRVTLPIRPEAPGKVVVERGGRSIELRALPHASASDQDPHGWREVFVVDMEDGVARVAPVDEDLLLNP